MTRRLWIRSMLGLLLGLCAAQGLPAQGPGRDAPEVGATELREAMREYFQNRLRSELSLSDDQSAHILPRVQRLEESKVASRRQRMEAVRRLRRGYENGAADAELQEMLDRLEQIEREQQVLERSTLAEIDQVLAVRQRVQLRFFMNRFRQDMQERVRDLRRDPSERGRQRRFPQRRRPGGEPRF